MIDIKKVKERIEKYKRNSIIYAHADHDGICASVGLNYIFGRIETKFSQFFRPKNIPCLKNKKLFIVCDLQLSEKQINYLLNKGLEVINFDHHEIRDIKHKNYLCLNPKKIYGKELISSSGLIWKIFRPEKVAWILAVGSAGDLAVEDNIELFKFVKKKYPELLEDTSLKAIYSSKIFELAQILLMSFDNPEEGFTILKKNIETPQNIFKSSLYEKYRRKQKIIQKFFEEQKNRVIEHPKFVLIDTSNLEYAGSYSDYLNLKFKDKRVYIEYDNGRLFFRNYFGNEDIRNVAKLFGGGGAHRRAGGAHTRKTFNEVYELIKNYYEKKSTFDFK